MAKPYATYGEGETIRITTPTSDLKLRSPLVIKLAKAPVENDGLWICEGYRLTRKGARRWWAKEARRWIATTISPAHFA